MELHIALPTGKIINLQEDASNTIKHVKEVIQAKENIPYDQQLLMINIGREITDDCKLSDCNPYGNSKCLFGTILKLDMDVMQIDIESNQATYKLHGVKSLETVDELESKIKKNFQDLEYLIYHSTRLQKGHTLSYYNIQNGSRLMLYSDEKILVFAKSLTGKTDTYEINPFDTLKVLKEMIADRTSIPPHYQRLIFNTLQLTEDSHRLHEYNIKHYSTIHMVVRIPGGGYDCIYVKTSMGKTLLSIKLSSWGDPLTIEDIKSRIQATEYIPPHKQRLTFDGQILRNYHTIYYYDIKPGDSIYLTVIVGMDIFIKTLTGKAVILCVNLSDTIECMINEVYNTIEILPDQHRFIYAGQILNNKYLYTLSGFDIPANATIYLISKDGEMMEIFLKTTAGRSFTIIFKMHGFEIVHDLKEKIQHEEGIPIDKQKLFFDGKVLENEFLLLDCGIQKESNLTLEDTSWVISRSEIFLDHENVIIKNWGYFAKAMYKGCIVHVKCLNKTIDNDSITEFWAMQMEKSFHCHHFNIVKFVGGIVEHPIVVITELMDTTLQAALSGRRVTSNHIYLLSMDIAKGLLYLHSNQPHSLIHGNVSPDNVLLKISGIGWKAKLSYLGCVHIYNKNQISVAPEVRIAGEESVKMDVYSFGMLLAEMTMRSHDPIQMELRKWPHFKPIIDKCIIQNPNRRPLMKEVVDHLE